MEAATRRLRVGFPAAGFAGRDLWGLRVVLVILLLLGTIDAGTDWRDRLARAITPALPGGSEALAGSLDIWVTPPEYTGLPPQFLRAGTGETVSIPIGSALLAQVHGGAGVPHLATDDEVRDFDAVDKNNFRIAATLTFGKQLGAGGAMLGRWSIEIIPDNRRKPPLRDCPGDHPRGAARRLQASGDYGVEAVKGDHQAQGGKPTRQLKSRNPAGITSQEAQATNITIVAPHPWAGLPVEIRLVAIDALAGWRE